MNWTKLMATTLMAGALCSCAESADKKADASFIGKNEIQIEGDRMTPEALWAMGRIGSMAPSPDGTRIAYGVSYYSVPQNKSHRVIYMMNADGTENHMLTTSTASEGDVTWIKGGTKLAYLSTESGTNQLWEMNPDGTGRHQLTDLEKGVEGYKFSPDEKKIILIMTVQNGLSTADRHPDLPLTTGRVINDLMYKHWDEWVDEIPHPFVADFDGKGITNMKDILEGELYESPMRPFGGTEQFAWSPDGTTIAYTCRKKTGAAYSKSTDSDIYLYDVATGETRNICKADATDKNLGYDTNPQYSPDGSLIAWQSMERDGYESDWNRLYVMDLTTGEKRFVSRAFDSNVDEFVWIPNGKGFYFSGVWHGTSMIYSLDLEGNVTQLTEGQYDFGGITLMGDRILCKRHSMAEADEIYAFAPSNGKGLTQLTTENKHIYDQIERGKVEPRWMTTTDGKQMLTWVIYPPHFDPAKKYPTLLFCEGGPQSPVSQFWSYRWNFQIMAANDYIIVAPNRRGLPGFGLEWNEAISGDYGGQCMKDYLTAIDEMAKEPYVDADRLGCVGASFGGFSVYWLAGHHEKRFKAFIAHDGFFNMEQQYYETEESWFPNWDLGGAPYEDSEEVRRSYANSPHRFVDKWDTPILLIHGDRDYRILSSQSMAAFNAARLRGVPAQLLLFPDENHWVLKPQNGILWQRTFFAWLDRWLKD
mgnify:FL=1